MGVQHYAELIAWQKAMDLAVGVYKATANYPESERFGLVNQTRRAAVSVPSNIAEGQGRGTTKDFCQFLYIARGSLQEMETQTILAERLGFLSPEARANLNNLSTEVGRILGGLLRSLVAGH